MSTRRYAAKRDVNEREIIDALEAVGASVQQLSESGVPDLLVGHNGVNYLMEVKTRRGKLTAHQMTWIAEYRGYVYVVRTVEDALAAIGVVS